LHAVGNNCARQLDGSRSAQQKDMMMVMNECHPGMKLNPHSHTFEQMAYIVSGRAIYHVGDIGHEVGAGSFLVIPAGVVHYVEPLGTEPVMNLDFFLPAREDYMHLVKYLDEDKQADKLTGVHPLFKIAVVLRCVLEGN
jgi:quercetin dioxygenase-like cupin family protein